MVKKYEFPMASILEESINRVLQDVIKKQEEWMLDHPWIVPKDEKHWEENIADSSYTLTTITRPDRPMNFKERQEFKDKVRSLRQTDEVRRLRKAWGF